MYRRQKSIIDEFFKNKQEALKKTSYEEVKKVLTATFEGISQTMDGMWLDTIRIPNFGKFYVSEYHMPTFFKHIEKLRKQNSISEEDYEINFETFKNFCNKRNIHQDLIKQYEKRKN